MSNPVADDILMHYGVKRRSGRYPWGSGDNPYQHSGDFLARVQELRAKGLTEGEIVKSMGLDSSTQLRTAYKVAKDERKRLELDRIKSLQSDGYSISEIGRMMGMNESSVRSKLNENRKERLDVVMNTKDILAKELENKKILDVGPGVERELGVTRNVLDTAVYMLEAENGVNRYGIGVPQVTNPGKQTNFQIITVPGVEQKYLYDHMDEIMSVRDYYSDDGGSSWNKREYPASIDSNRVQIRYGDEGGNLKDGVIEIRPGVADLNLGNSSYAQVRILVDGDHYLKGMAIYSDDLPKGTDIVFNTNKETGTPKMEVLKKIKDDPDDPFGAYIKADGQSFYIDPKTGEKKLSAINKLKEESDWDEQSKTLSSQFLGKQPQKFIEERLNYTYKDKALELDEIRSITNPTIRIQELIDFADGCDKDAETLKAAALPGQSSKVILPVTKIKDTEVYAPTYKNGTKVVLIRYPHGGTFEIPELVVNNRNPEAKKILGNVQDAIGINAEVAKTLSGADFDGDSVTVIPLSDKVKVKTSPSLRYKDPLTNTFKDLKDFDPKEAYPKREGMKVLTKENTQREMGIVSNLIMDMTLKGAPESEIARAVKHSMVVIDAAKHELDYKQSEKDNGIKELKKKWQTDPETGKSGGASTLITRKGQEVRVPERQGSPHINPDTGEYEYKESGRTYYDKKTGQYVKATTKVSLMSVTKDANTLSSGTPQERAYATYANKMKALANTARKEARATKGLEYDKGAAVTYKDEVKSLKAKIDVAAMNAPRERRAQAIANSIVKAKMADNPGMTKKEIRKARQTAIQNARASVSAKGKDTKIKITDKEWEAIQAGAVSDSRVKQVLRYADKDDLRKRALPKTTSGLSKVQEARIKTMYNSGYTYEEIASRLGKSTSVIGTFVRDNGLNAK